MATPTPASYYSDKFKVGVNKEIKLKDWETDDNDKPVNKNEGEEFLRPIF